MPKKPKKPNKTKSKPSSQGTRCSSWNLTCPAHNSTWAYLGRNEDLSAPFPDAAGVQLKTLRYWNDAGDGSSLTGPKGLALRLDGYFTEALYVPYEQGVQFALAIEGLLEITKNGQATVLELAQRADALYDFWGEDA